MIIKESCKNTIVIDKSEFIANIIPVFSIEEINRLLADVRKTYFDASHHCYGYILGDQMNIQKCSDDGEPSKTAGFPILEVLKKEQLTNILCIVSRYFGGIKLGPGGLIRAYSNCCSEALKLATFQEKKEIAHIDLTVSYELIGSVERYIRENSDLENTLFDSDVTYIISLLKEKKEIFIRELINLSKGKIKIMEYEDSFKYFDL